MRAVPLALVFALLGGERSAGATNGLHPRTPVVWDRDGVCGLVVVRGEEPSLNLPYTLPDANQDGMLDSCDDDPTPDGCAEVPNQPLGADEVADSRRHQFFGLCRQYPLDVLLPAWISEEDVAASAKVETCCSVNECPGPMCPLVDPAAVGADDVLDTAPAWDDCAVRINGDSQRFPIEVARAAKGVDWELADVEPGVYSIEGYTWEPPINVWSRRPGFVKVVDRAEDAALHPAIAIVGVEDEVNKDHVIEGCEQVSVIGCVDAGEGATVDLFWRLSAPGEPIAWHRVITDEPVENGMFELSWAPESLPSGTVLVRADVSDGCGTYTAHATFALDVLAGEECEDGAVFMDSGEPEEHIDDEDNRDENSCVGEGGGQDGERKPPGCGCTATPTGPAGLALSAAGLLLLGLARGRGRG